MIKDIVLGLLIFSFIPTSPQLPTKQLPEPHKLSEYSTPQFTYTKNRSDIMADLEQSQTFSSLASVVEATIPKPVEKPVETPVSTPSTTPSGSCRDWIIQAGVTDVESAYALIMRESGCNPNATNPSSGACGIPQALPCSKLPADDPVGQIKWMQEYCIGRYGSWAAANLFQLANGWY